MPRGWFSTAWVVAITLYATVRALAAWPTLGQYGVNPLVFLVIDIASAPPYAMGQVGIVQGIRERRWPHVQIWAAVVLVTFLAPYAYIVIAGRGELPLFGYIVIGVIVVVFGAASIMRIRSQVRDPVDAPNPGPSPTQS